MRRDSRASGCSTPSWSSTPTTARRRSSRRSSRESAIAPISASSPRCCSPSSSAANASRSSSSCSSRSRAASPSAANEPGNSARIASASSRSPRASQDPRQRDAGVGATRLQLERAAQVRLGARGDQRVGLRGQQRVEEARDHGGRLRAGELGIDAAVLERLHRRDALDPERGREARVGLGVDLGQRELAGALGDRLLEHRGELAARAAPRGPEVDDDRQLLRALDHLLFEIGLGGVEDHAV